jgi:hypothetical protein
MKKKFLPLVSLIVILLLTQAACQIGVPTAEAPPPPPAPTQTATPGPAPTPIVMPAGGEQPTQITGSFTYTNGIAVETYYVEQAVALADMHGFVVRDQEWKTSIDSQVLGYLSIDKTKKQGAYHLDLPSRPERPRRSDLRRVLLAEPGRRAFRRRRRSLPWLAELPGLGQDRFW